MRKSAWFTLIMLGVVDFWSHGALGAEPIQTQLAMAGDAEVDVVKAAVQEGILTVVLAYRNTGKTSFAVRGLVSDVYYLDDSEKKKYQVLHDSKNEWIAAPLYAGGLNVDVGPGEKRAIWFKFPGPPAAAKTINLIVPGVLPFEKLPITR